MTTTTVSSFAFDEVENCVMKAMKDFRKRDLRLLELTVNERASTHRIACYLQKYFQGWHVDCEYNRKRSDQKRSPVAGSNGRIKPDIIIHRRKTENNLLCIEAKKSGGSLDELDVDRKRLAGFTNSTGEYKYRFGLLIILSLTKPYKIDYEWFRDGKNMGNNQPFSVREE